MHLSTISEWLTKIGSIHIQEVELGLDRVRAVAQRLALLPPSCPVIIVGGTNGKGSTVAGLESIYRAAGYHVGVFTSPFLFKHNEQVRVDGENTTDDQFCSAFVQIEAVRNEVSLTPFEFITLAALLIFKSHPLDVMILEVGLGGRLDAVNILDAQIAVITSIGIDHVEWLGHTREDIAREKAGIFRGERPAVCGDFEPPVTLIQAARDLGTTLYCQGKDFHYEERENSWSFSSQDGEYTDLPLNALATENMATVLMTVTLMKTVLPVRRDHIDAGLTATQLTGRIQVVEGPITEIYDVAHNPAAVKFLAHRLKQMPMAGKTYAVFSMLADKDIIQSIAEINFLIDRWYVAPLNTKRGATSSKLIRAFQYGDMTNVMHFLTIRKAFDYALAQAETGDRIVIFGSFHTVAEVMEHRGLR